jgi:type IV secretory pathway component VirB8
MEKNSEHKKAKDEETLSDQEIWSTIRYLDPEVKDKAAAGGLIIALLALFAIVGVVVGVLYSCGL